MFTLAAALLIASQTRAADVEFKKLDLTEGIAIEVPSRWAVFSDAMNKSINNAGEAGGARAGLAPRKNRKTALLTARNSATSAEAAAMVRVNVISPPSYTQADLEKATAKDMAEIKKQFAAAMIKAEGSGVKRFIAVTSARVEMAGARRAMVLESTRHALNGDGIWVQTQYTIPSGDRAVELSLSYLVQDAGRWRPIMDRIRRSLTF